MVDVSYQLTSEPATSEIRSLEQRIRILELEVELLKKNLEELLNRPN